MLMKKISTHKLVFSKEDSLYKVVKTMKDDECVEYIIEHRMTNGSVDSIIIIPSRLEDLLEIIDEARNHIINEEK